MPPLPYRTRLQRQNILPFNWSADDGEVLACRSGQAMTFSRAATQAVVTNTATVTVAQHCPAWADYALGASHLINPSAAWTAAWFAQVQALWVYVAGYVPAQTGSGTSTLFQLGSGTATSFLLQTTFDSSGLLNTIGKYQDGTGNPSVTLSPGTLNPVVGSYAEFILQMDSAYKATVSRAVNAGTVQTSSLSSAGVAYPASTLFQGSTLRIADSANATYFAYRQLIVGFGPAPTFAQIRALAR